MIHQGSPPVDISIVFRKRSVLAGRMTNLFNHQTEAAGGVPAVAQILNVTDRMTNKGILESLEQQDADLLL